MRGHYVRDLNQSFEVAIASPWTKPILTSFALSPDEKRFAFGGEDGTLKIIERFTGKVIKNLEAHATALAAIEYSPDGRHMVSISEDGIVRLWNFDLGLQADERIDGRSDIGRILGLAEEGLTFAKAEVPRCLSPAERKAFYLQPAPPRWCITGAGLERSADIEDWRPLPPYQGTAWRDWLIARDAGADIELPLNEGAGDD